MVFNVTQGGRDAFNSLFYPPPTYGVMDAFNEDLSRIKGLVGEYANKFIAEVNNIYNYFNGNEAIENAKLNMYRAESVLRNDVIYPVSFDNLGSANTIMQRYIMAHPAVMELHRKNMCNGFSETYLDYDDNTEDSDNHEYNQVMSGMLRFDENDNGYYEEIISVGIDGNTNELDLIDKAYILETWDNVMEAIAQGIDPTDPNRGKL